MLSVLLLLVVLAAEPRSRLLAAGAEDRAGPPPCDDTRFPAGIPLPAHCVQIGRGAGVVAAGRSSRNARPCEAARLGTTLTEACRNNSTAGADDSVEPPSPCDMARFPASAPLPAHCLQTAGNAAPLATRPSSEDPEPVISPKIRTLDLICDGSVLGTQITTECEDGVSTRCCESVLASVDIRGCICTVMTDNSIRDSRYGLNEVIQMYRDCAGVRQLTNSESCKDLSDAPSPPAAGSASKGIQKTMQRLETGTLVVVVFGVVALGFAVVFVLYRLRNMQGRELFAITQEVASITALIRQLAGLPPALPLAAQVVDGGVPGQLLWVRVIGETLLGAARALGAIPQAPNAADGRALGAIPQAPNAADGTALGAIPQAPNAAGGASAVDGAAEVEMA